MLKLKINPPTNDETLLKMVDNINRRNVLLMVLQMITYVLILIMYIYMLFEKKINKNIIIIVYIVVGCCLEIQDLVEAFV